MRIAVSPGFAVFALAGAIAYAAIPDSTGAIHGCYSKTNGSLRVIDSSTSRCSPNEVSIIWNQTGREGPAGPVGPPGPAGPPGGGGPPGPSREQASSASGAASNTTAYKLVAPIVIGDLAGQNDDNGDHQIILPFVGRVLAIAQVLSSHDSAGRQPDRRQLSSSEKEDNGPQ